jgi:hypothetical protein
MKPGEVLAEGLLGFHACAVLNDLGRVVMLPSVVLEAVKDNSGLIPEWPLGVYVLFTDEGVLLGIHGKNIEGSTLDKYSFLDLNEDTIPDLGEDTWNLWKLLREASDELVEVNYQTLLKQTLERGT